MKTGRSLTNIHSKLRELISVKRATLTNSHSYGKAFSVRFGFVVTVTEDLWRPIRSFVSVSWEKEITNIIVPSSGLDQMSCEY